MALRALPEVSSLKLIVVAAVAVLAISWPAAAQESAIDDETCLMCHDGLDATLAATAHRLSSQVNKPAVDIGCVSCHPGGEAHADDPEVDNITNPSSLPGHEAAGICGGCHTPHRDLDNYGFDSHSSQQLNCSECHRVHGGRSDLLLDDNASFCQRCHIETVTKFRRRSNHPVLQGNLTCLSCHRFTRRADFDVAYDLQRVCQDCHPYQGGPFLYEHEAVNAYSVEGGGCVECHEPHGSENDRLLKQPGNQLCLQCHLGHVTSNHGSAWDLVWSELPCQTCHTETHGSFVSNLYLRPDLPALFGGDCYQSGCHSLNGQ